MENELTLQTFILMILFALGLVCFMVSQIGIFMPKMNPLMFHGRGSRPLSFVAAALLGFVFVLTAIGLSKSNNTYLFMAGGAFVLALFFGQRAIRFARNNKNSQ